MPESVPATGQKAEGAGGTGQSSPLAAAPSTPAIGQRAAFRSIARELTENDLKDPGVQKLLLEIIDRTDGECAELKDFRDKYFLSAIQEGRLTERLKPARSIEVFFGVGVGVGCTLLGAAISPGAAGPSTNLVRLTGVVLIVGSVLGRLLK